MFHVLQLEVQLEQTRQLLAVDYEKPGVGGISKGGKRES